MRIGLDVDGVLYQWSPQVRRILEMKYRIVLPESKSWNFLKENVPPEVWEQLWLEDIESMYLDGPFYPGAQDTVKRLSKKHDVYLITAAPKSVRGGRTHHLSNRLPDISGIVYVPVLSSDKTFVECAIYLDDKVETTAITALKRPEARSLLMNRPWNEEVPTPEGVTRIHNWDELFVAVAEREREEQNG